MSRVASPTAARWRGLIFGLFVWSYFLMMSFFLFDSPQASGSIPTLSLAWSIWSYPLVHLLALILSRVAASKQADTKIVQRLARLWWLNIIWFVSSFGWIILICGGELGCAWRLK